MDRREQYLIAAFKLSRVHPDTWAEFVNAFSAYATQSALTAVMVTSPEALPRSTARASALLDILGDFSTIDDLFNKIAAKQSRQQDGR